MLDNDQLNCVNESFFSPTPLEYNIKEKFDCPHKDYIGKFPKNADYDQVVNQDCDVYLEGEKVLSFRKSIVPHLKEGSNSKSWGFFRKASREVYGTQRGVVAGTQFTTRTEARLTKGQVAFFSQSSLGLITSLTEARKVLRESDELTVKTLKTKYIKKAFPSIAERLLPLERALKDSSLEEETIRSLTQEKRRVLWSWFDDWLENVWSPSENKVAETNEVVNRFISSQLNFNHCYSNVLGAIDRGARFPYGRMSLTTQKNWQDFENYRDIYKAVDQEFKNLYPTIWREVYSTISKVKDPCYNLFDTAFTSITLNFNFRTAYHVDKNNLKGAMAALSVTSKGNYEGHFLVFPELRLAFDVRDGDFLIADTQNLLHGNTPMVKLSEEAERISLVFYARENMAYLDDLQCESCRRDFVKYSAENLKEKSKKHGDWRGVWPNMWVSEEWFSFRKERGLLRCSNSNWQLSSPYKNTKTGEMKLFKCAPSSDWELVETLESNT